jgi:hypothetical protein
MLLGCKELSSFTLERQLCDEPYLSSRCKEILPHNLASAHGLKKYEAKLKKRRLSTLMWLGHKAYNKMSDSTKPRIGKSWCTSPRYFWDLIIKPKKCSNFSYMEIRIFFA